MKSIIATETGHKAVINNETDWNAEYEPCILENFMSMLKAGAAQIDIRPKDSQFLFGYPHIRRYSTGIHDRLWSSALYLYDGKTEIMFIANDIISCIRKILNHNMGQIIFKQNKIFRRY